MARFIDTLKRSHYCGQLRAELARNATLVSMSEVALDKLARIGAEQKHIDVLRTEVTKLMDGDNPFDRGAFAKTLETELLAA